MSDGYGYCWVAGCDNSLRRYDKDGICLSHSNRLKRWGDFHETSVTCQQCGRNFKTDDVRIKTCSDKCRLDRNSEGNSRRYWADWEENVRKRREYALKNRDKILAQKRIYRQENREKVRRVAREWHSRNKDRVNEEVRIRRAQGLIPHYDRWAKRNPDAVRAIKKRYRAKRQGLIDGGFRFSKKFFSRSLHRHRNCCAYCGEGFVNNSHTCEHVVPLTRGGVHGESNLIPVCQSCNSSKGNKFYMEWRMLRIRAGVLGKI